MNLLKRGVAFWKEAWHMARSQPALLRPAVMAGLLGLAISLLIGVLLAATVAMLGERILFPVLTGFLLAVLVLAVLAVGFVFSAQMVFLVYNRLAAGDAPAPGDQRQVDEIMRRDWPDYLALAGALPAAAATRILPASPGADRPAWAETAAWALPVMVLEDTGLRDSLERAAQLADADLLPESARRTGVDLVNGLAAAGMGLLGLLVGAAAGVAIMQAFPGRGGLAAGIIVWTLLANLLFLPAVIFGAFASAISRAAQYLWARDVEQARAAGRPEPPAPGPLAAVLELDEDTWRAGDPGSGSRGIDPIE